MRVLVVEDNRPRGGLDPDDARSAKIRRQRRHRRRDGARSSLRRCYDAAVVDVGLPGIDGFALARNARAEGVQTPILMLTARDAVEDRVAGLDCGADDYLVKPFVEEELIARIARDPAPRRPADGRRRRSRCAAHRPRGRATSATTVSR